MSSPYEQLDKLVRDVAELTGKHATLKLRVEALEARQIRAFGTDANGPGKMTMRDGKVVVNR